jgi:hypothetical protein
MTWVVLNAITRVQTMVDITRVSDGCESAIICNCKTCVIMVNVKLSLLKPWRLLGLQEVDAATFSDIRLIDGGKVISPIASHFLPQEDSWYSFLFEAELTPGP